MSDKATPVKREKFYNIILELYADGVEMTARECAEKMYNMKIIPFPMRQYTAPRLVELCKMNMMERVGSKLDETTRKYVTIYKRKEEK